MLNFLMSAVSKKNKIMNCNHKSSSIKIGTLKCKNEPDQVYIFEVFSALKIALEIHTTEYRQEFYEIDHFLVYIQKNFDYARK